MFVDVRTMNLLQQSRYIKTKMASVFVCKLVWPIVCIMHVSIHTHTHHSDSWCIWQAAVEVSLHTIYWLLVWTKTYSRNVLLQIPFWLVCLQAYSRSVSHHIIYWLLIWPKAYSRNVLLQIPFWLVCLQAYSRSVSHHIIYWLLIWPKAYSRNVLLQIPFWIVCLQAYRSVSLHIIYWLLIWPKAYSRNVLLQIPFWLVCLQTYCRSVSLHTIFLLLVWSMLASRSVSIAVRSNFEKSNEKQKIPHCQNNSQIKYQNRRIWGKINTLKHTNAWLLSFLIWYSHYRHLNKN